MWCKTKFIFPNRLVKRLKIAHAFPIIPEMAAVQQLGANRQEKGLDMLRVFVNAGFLVGAVFCQPPKIRLARIHFIKNIFHRAQRAEHRVICQDQLIIAPHRFPAD